MPIEKYVRKVVDADYHQKRSSMNSIISRLYYVGEILTMENPLDAHSRS